MTACRSLNNLKLAKSMLLAKPWQYALVYRKGRRFRGRELSVILLPNGGEVSRLGISIHGIKQAVRRNRIKRIIREYFRLNRTNFGPACDVVFAVRSGFRPDSPAEVSLAVQKIMGRPEVAG